MDPLRLHLLIFAAVSHCAFSPPLAQGIYDQALRQYHACYPLTGASLTWENHLPAVIVLGRN